MMQNSTTGPFFQTTISQCKECNSQLQLRIQQGQVDNEQMATYLSILDVWDNSAMQQRTVQSSSAHMLQPNTITCGQLFVNQDIFCSGCVLACYAVGRIA